MGVQWGQQCMFYQGGGQGYFKYERKITQLFANICLHWQDTAVPTRTTILLYGIPDTNYSTNKLLHKLPHKLGTSQIHTKLCSPGVMTICIYHSRTCVLVVNETYPGESWYHQPSGPSFTWRTSCLRKICITYLKDALPHRQGCRIVESAWEPKFCACQSA